MTSRYDRQIRFFGASGQHRIEEARIVVLGCGGLAMHVIQQLAYLGVRHWTLVDHDDVDETSLNRLVTALPSDEDRPKLEIATRLIRSLQPDAEIDPIDGLVGDPDIEPRLSRRVSEADLVIGCFDNETPRMYTTRLCSEKGVPYIDAATDIVNDDCGLSYGGRVIAAQDGTGCLACLEIIDVQELRREQMTAQQRAEHDRIYGIDRGDLEGAGSVCGDAQWRRRVHSRNRGDDGSDRSARAEPAVDLPRGHRWRQPQPLARQPGLRLLRPLARATRRGV